MKMMLRPNKHSHPDKTVINIAFLLLSYLKKNRVEEYDTLRRYVRKNVPDSDLLFLPALNFLYLLGLIAYFPKNDTIEYLETNEII
jgi:hypothetical protein